MIDLGTDPSVLFSTVLVPLQILVVDLLLSADNALMIALACRGLPQDDVRQVALFGTAGAIVLRLAMAAAAVLLLRVPYLKLIGGLALLLIAVRVTLAPGDEDERAEAYGGDPAGGSKAGLLGRTDLLGAIGAIIVADAVMSLDNVVAVAAIAGGSLVLLGFGLALSIPMLVWGSTLIRRFLDQNGLLVLLSSMFLGWLAGGIGVSDPAVAPWVEASAPALPFAVPLACAGFVLWQSWILAPRRAPDGGIDAG